MKSFVILLSICLLGSFFVPSPGTGTAVDPHAAYAPCALSNAGCDAPMPAERGEFAAVNAIAKASCNEDSSPCSKHFRPASVRAHVAAGASSGRFTVLLAAAHGPAPELSRLQRLNI